MVFQKQFEEYDLVIEVYNHRRIDYCEHPSQSYLLTVWEKGWYQGNANGFENKAQALEGAASVRTGMSLAFHITKQLGRVIHIIETNEDHDILTADYIPVPKEE